MNTHGEAPVQADIDELHKNARTAEDLEVLSQWQAEVDEERAEAVKGLGQGQPRLSRLPDGSVVTEQEAAAQKAEGSTSHPYGNAGRRA